MILVYQSEQRTFFVTLSRDRLYELLLYNQKTGEFTWKKNRKKALVGVVAGCRAKTGYWVITIGTRRYYTHRLAWFYMTGAWPSKQIDHINGQRDDNRWCNLREATYSQNQTNSGQRTEMKKWVS